MRENFLIAIGAYATMVGTGEWERRGLK